MRSLYFKVRVAALLNQSKVLLMFFVLVSETLEKLSQCKKKTNRFTMEKLTFRYNKKIMAKESRNLDKHNKYHITIYIDKI